MKERILLFIIILGLSILIYVYQSYINTLWGLILICIGLFLYALTANLAYKIKKRVLKKRPDVVNEAYKPFVTVMIPAHNEENVISHTVANIEQMDYPNFEVIVIDDRSDDNTAVVMKNLEQEYNNLKAFIRPKDAFPGKSAVLNDAMQFAKGEAILVFDADATVEHDFLKKLVPLLEPEDVGAVQARKIIRNKDYNLLTRCQNNEYTLDAQIQISRDSVKGAVELRGNGELIKRKALEDIGGWNNYTITDDLDMSTRLHIKGWDIRFSMDTVVYEEGIAYILPLYRQRRRWLEGTIRRYLEYFVDVLTSKEMSLRASLDMTIYILQFIIPGWFLLEFFIRMFKWIVKDASPNIVYSSLIVGAAIGIGFLFSIRYALRRYDNVPRISALVQSFQTTVYFFLIWFPLVLYISFKILFLKKDMKWGKTAHGLVQEEEANINKQLEKV
ncbi:glycosyltransferase family 2 protein [bacterium]|nr:glycosyltransferase family 2 protein [bacterium]